MLVDNNSSGEFGNRVKLLPTLDGLEALPKKASIDEELSSLKPHSIELLNRGVWVYDKETNTLSGYFSKFSRADGCRILLGWEPEQLQDKSSTKKTLDLRTSLDFRVDLLVEEIIKNINTNEDKKKKNAIKAINSVFGDSIFQVEDINSREIFKQKLKAAIKSKYHNTEGNSGKVDAFLSDLKGDEIGYPYADKLKNYNGKFIHQLILISKEYPSEEGLKKLGELRKVGVTVHDEWGVDETKRLVIKELKNKQVAEDKQSQSRWRLQ